MLAQMSVIRSPAMPDRASKLKICGERKHHLFLITTLALYQTRGSIFHIFFPLPHVVYERPQVVGEKSD